MRFELFFFLATSTAWSITGYQGDASGVNNGCQGFSPMSQADTSPTPPDICQQMKNGDTDLGLTSVDIDFDDAGLRMQVFDNEVCSENVGRVLYDSKDGPWHGCITGHAMSWWVY